jgi:hypothetical protein
MLNAEMNVCVPDNKKRMVRRQSNYEEDMETQISNKEEVITNANILSK